MPKVTNTFQGGVTKDFAVSAQPPNTALDSKNFRSSPAKSQGSRASKFLVQGNQLKFTIPTVTIHNLFVEMTVTPGSFRVNIGSDTEVFIVNSVNQSPSPKQIRDKFSTKPGFDVNYKIHYNSQYLTVLELTGSIVVEALLITGSMDYSADILTGINNSIIGGDVIKDWLVLITADDVNNFDGFWKTQYDETTDTVTLDINDFVFGADLGLSTDFPILDTLTRYENDCVGRVYFTDFNTPFRKMNVLDENSLATVPTFLNLRTDVNFDKIILKDILRGSLISGVYQYFYRYINLQGTETGFSPGSNLITVVEDSEGVEAWSNYHGNSTVPDINTGKSLRLKFNVDNRYDFVEIASAFYRSGNSDPEINIISRLKITRGEMEFIHSGDESNIPLTIEELNLTGNAFTHCKSFDEKDNQLIIANTRDETPDLTFDSRAYRFDSTRMATIEGSPNITIDGTPPTPDWDSVPEDHDAINPFNQEDPTLNPDWLTADQYQFQSDGVTLGGEGKFIKYTFVKQSMEGDKYNNSLPQVRPFQIRGKYPLDFELVPGQIHSLSKNSWDTLQNPLISGLLRGLFLGEIYRIGIVLFDKQGTPGFVNWIGDIKIPEDTDAFPIGFVDGSSFNRINSIGIKFDITIPSNLASQASGYSIVRVRRKEKDKTRLSMGILNQVSFYETTGGVGDKNDPAAHVPTQYVEGYNNNSNPYNSTLNTRLLLFDSPETHFGKLVTSNGDIIKIIGRTTNNLIKPYYNKDYPDSGNNHRLTWIKHRGMAAPLVANKEYEIQNSQYVVPGEKVELSEFLEDISTEDIFLNATVGINASALIANQRQELYMESFANSSLLLGFSTTEIPDLNGDVGTDGDGDVSGINGPGTPPNNFIKAIASYVRYQAKQYGGNTFFERSNSTYISTGHFSPMNTKLDFNQIIDIYGGDVFSTFYGATKLERNSEGRNITDIDYLDFTSPNDTDITGQMYPTQASFNVELREGIYFDNNTEQANPEFQTDDVIYNDVWHQESNSRSFIPEPIIKLVSDRPRILRASLKKFDGETIDSWGKFPVNNVKTADGKYDEINKVINFKGKIYIWQRSAFASILVNPVSQVQDNNGTNIVLGTGDVFQHIDYISVDYGTIHTLSVIQSDIGMYAYDALKNRHLKFSLDSGTRQLSVIKGFHGFFESVSNIVRDNFNPLKATGVISGYDYANNELLLTIYTNNNPVEGFTLIYNEQDDTYSGNYTFNPSVYINYNQRLLSVPQSSLNKLYEHNRGKILEFYDVKQKASLSFVVNQNFEITKRFESLEMFTQCKERPNGNDVNTTFTRIRCFTDGQNTDFVDLIVNSDSLRKLNNEWHLHVPKNILKENLINPDIFDPANFDPTRKFKDLLRDKFMVVELEFVPSDDVDLELFVHYINTNFVTSYR